MRQFLITVIALLLLLLLLALSSMVVILSSESGTAFLCREIKNFLPNTLIITQAKGILGSNITIEKIRYISEHQTIELNQLHLHWQWQALLRQTVHIKALSIQSIVIDNTSPVASESNPTSSSVSFSLPIKLNIQQLAIAQLRLINPNRAQTQLTDLRGALSLVPDEPFHVDLRLAQIQLQDKIFYQFVNSHLTLEGNFSDYEGKLVTHFKNQKTFENRLSFYFTGSEHTLSLDSLVTEKEKNLLALKATFDFEKTLHWQSTLTLNNLDLSHYLQYADFDSPIRRLSGKLQIGGEYELGDKKLSLSLSSDAFTLAQNKLFQLSLSPDLTLYYQPGKVTLNGLIHIPKANLSLLDQFVSPESLSPDVKVSKEKTLKPTTPLSINADLQLIVGPDVVISVQGLTGKLQGDLHIQQTPNTAAVGEGTLSIVSGQFRAYGQTLVIETGKLLFLGGNINNPGLDIRASKTLNLSNTAPSDSLSFRFDNQGKLILGIAATGPLRRPNIGLFSEPAGMSQADILSMIVLGQPVNQASQSGANLLLAASQALNVADSSKITDQVKETLGLDVVEVASFQNYNQQTGTAETNTSLVLGKYLSPKVYIDYSIGLFGQTDLFEIRYLFNRNWSLKTQTGTLSVGADLNYVIEKD